MAEFAGITYDETECELFCWHVTEVIAVIDKIRANIGDDYADEYTRQLTYLISHGPGGAPELSRSPGPLGSVS